MLAALRPSTRRDDPPVPPPLSLHEPQNWPPVLSATEVAHLLRVDRQTIVSMIGRGEIPGVKVGKQWRIAPEDVWPLIPAATRARWPPGPWRPDPAAPGR
jgi:excisionase family DNA binding protein